MLVRAIIEKRLGVEYPCQGKLEFGTSCVCFLLANIAIVFICSDSVQLGSNGRKSVDRKEFDCRTGEWEARVNSPQETTNAKG